MLRTAVFFHAVLLAVYAGAAPIKEEATKVVHVPFEKAEVEMLSRFRQDVPVIEKTTDRLAVYQVTATGKLPSDYSTSLRQRIEEILLTSKRLQVVDCSGCQVSRLVKDADGSVRYETFSEEPNRPAKMATELGVQYLLHVDMNYTPNDIQLRARLIHAKNGEIAWTNEYSSSNILRDKERIASREYGLELTESEGSLSHVIIGEIAFSFVFSPGIAFLPTLEGTYGSGHAFYPSIDLLIGEKYDNGHKRFGFVFGAITKAAKDDAYSKQLPWAIRIAPQFRYTFNPYNTHFARWSLITELGGFISQDLATAYFSAGPEMMMVKRFSIALLPMFILPATMKGSVPAEAGDEGGAYTYNSGESFGGFGVLFKGSMNW